MREIRICPVGGGTVILNDRWPDRHLPAPAPPEQCPLCRLSAAGPVIARSGGQGGGAVAVPHPEPILGIEGDPAPRTEGGRVRQEGVGAHELIIGAHDEGRGGDLAMLRLLRARERDLRGDRRLLGFAAARRWTPGHHTCWQLIALPQEPVLTAPVRWRELELEERGGAVLQMAWAPRVPFEAWVLPAAGRARWAAEEGQALAGATALLARWLPVFSAALGGAAGTVIDVVRVDGEPWRLELRPQAVDRWLPEAATGWAAHGAFPEEAARFLRARAP